jgi:hypothetical protein
MEEAMTEPSVLSSQLSVAESKESLHRTAEELDTPDPHELSLGLAAIEEARVAPVPRRKTVMSADARFVDKASL